MRLQVPIKSVGAAFFVFMLVLVAAPLRPAIADAASINKQIEELRAALETFQGNTSDISGNFMSLRKAMNDRERDSNTRNYLLRRINELSALLNLRLLPFPDKDLKDATENLTMSVLTFRSALPHEAAGSVADKLSEAISAAVGNGRFAKFEPTSRAKLIALVGVLEDLLIALEDTETIRRATSLYNQLDTAIEDQNRLAVIRRQPVLVELTKLKGAIVKVLPPNGTAQDSINTSAKSLTTLLKKVATDGSVANPESLSTTLNPLVESILAIRKTEPHVALADMATELTTKLNNKQWLTNFKFEHPDTLAKREALSIALEKMELRLPKAAAIRWSGRLEKLLKDAAGDPKIKKILQSGDVVAALNNLVVAVTSILPTSTAGTTDRAKLKRLAKGFVAALQNAQVGDPEIKLDEADPLVTNLNNVMGEVLKFRNTATHLPLKDFADIIVQRLNVQEWKNLLIETHQGMRASTIKLSKDLAEIEKQLPSKAIKRWADQLETVLKLAASDDKVKEAIKVLSVQQALNKLGGEITARTSWIKPRIHIISASYGDIRRNARRHRVCNVIKNTRAKCQRKPKCMDTAGAIELADLCGADPVPFAQPLKKGLRLSYVCMRGGDRLWHALQLYPNRWREIGRRLGVRRFVPPLQHALLRKKGIGISCVAPDG
ncbi:MAG: hypothetical protein AAGD43_03870 [Pseudomonadota bacterium]